VETVVCVIIIKLTVPYIYTMSEKNDEAKFSGT